MQARPIYWSRKPEQHLKVEKNDHLIMLRSSLGHMDVLEVIQMVLNRSTMKHRA